MQKPLVFLSLFLLQTVLLNAQGPARCVLSGRVLLSESNIPLIGAELYLSDYSPKRGLMDSNWSSTSTESDGKFSIDVKGSPRYMRIIRLQGDTIDVSMESIQCNTTRDILVPADEQFSQKKSYQSFLIGYQLPEIVLLAYNAHGTRQSLPAAVGIIDRHTIESTDQSSLQNSMNTLPGVVMESRGYGGSHRFSIRGSSLRSPFAVRNVKMYLDGIPLTAADGQTPLELVDPADIQSIEVVKGPAGSMYGNGNGGVLLMTTIPIDSGVVRIQTSIQRASSDSYRQNNSASVGFKTSELRISQVWQDYPGYRNQEFNRKNQISLRFKQRISSSQSLTLFGSYYTGNWGLPGALNQTQADTMPTMAVPFSYLNNASLSRDRYVAAISQNGKWGKHFSHAICLSFQNTHKENPYGTSAFNSGYKFEESRSLSGRATIDYDRTWKDLNLRATAGSEWQTEEYSIVEKTIDFSEPKDFKYSYDIGYLQSMSFIQSVIKWRDAVTLQAGLSTSNNEQYVRGKNAVGFEFDTTSTWGTSVLPRVAASIRLLKGLFLYRSFSAGAANPTVFEMIDQENNTYNLQLTSERGRLNELGIRHQIEGIGIAYSLTAYDFHIDRAILPYSVINAEGEAVQRYHNDGSTLQQGIEWTFEWKIIRNNHDFELKYWNNGTLNRHRFDKYAVDGTILNGKSLPGVPEAQMSTGIQSSYKGISFAVFDYWMDRTPLNNDNSAQTAAYHMVNVAASYQFSPLKNFDCTLQGGINNLLNVQYSSFLNLNGIAGKYYNPAPTINYFVGLHLNYTIPMR